VAPVSFLYHHAYPSYILSNIGEYLLITLYFSETSLNMLFFLPADLGRVVNVGSMLMTKGVLNFSDPDLFTRRCRQPGMINRYIPAAYTDSKIAMALITRELAQRFKGVINIPEKNHNPQELMLK
jgi:NAD(P)-dependent dehydrogenase (short-subunit alcohol dehydrogenase family)